jgi:NAD(P)-dependent dehydrogenase (short-subunit alcohol dehydrogenase family)
MRHVLVTGASSGIGRASSLALHAKGLHVWAGVRTSLEAEAAEAMGLHPVLLDVTDPAAVADAAGTILALSGSKLHALVNNAGIAVADLVELLSDQDLRRQFEVNLFGMHRVTRTFLPAIIASKGRVINIGSIAGRMGLPFMGPYVATMHAILGYTDTLRREVRHLGVKVSIIEPSQLDTPIWGKAAPDDDYLEQLPTHYRKLAKPMFTRTRSDNEGGANVEGVAELVVHAATSRLARARYPLPMRDRITSRVGELIPKFVMDRVVNDDDSRRTPNNGKDPS